MKKCEGLNIISYNEAAIDRNIQNLLPKLSYQYESYKAPYDFPTRFKSMNSL